MEFYLSAGFRATKDTKVSIPNGMEFYRARRGAELQSELFQFPTGWNSTINFTIIGFDCTVSIPNGMEFYPALYHLILKHSGFNSQRDGILLNLTSLNLSSLPSFNSQRDGILQSNRFELRAI